MDILELIDRLESMAAQAKKVPITGLAMIGAEQLAELIDQMRVAIPRSIHEAQDVLDRREAIVNQTMLDARRVRATAETDARTLVQDNELTREARKRGEELYAKAEAKAEHLLAAVEAEGRQRRAEADQYCQDALASLEEQLVSVLNTIHTGQRVLSPAEELVPAPAEAS